MTRDESNDEVLGALDATRWLFSLAYFILRDKKDALGAVFQAFARIGLVAQAQRKKEQKPRKGEVRQKISLDRLQMLQYLTYLSANVYEKIQEEQHLTGARLLTEEDMVVRYVKQLVMLYMTTNSLLATVGQSCVLFDLGTSEADLLYETVVQASEGVLWNKGDYSIRNAKRRIWTVLSERFDQFVTGYNGP